MRDEQHDTLSGDLSDAVELLRQAPPVRAAWREELLRAASTERALKPGVKPARRVSLSVPWALAAGLTCALVGAGAVTMMRSAPADVRAVAQAPASATVMLPVRFSLTAPKAGRVYIVGDFNDWNPTTLPMRRSADGRVWEVEVRLPLGRYNYAFMVDGRLARDPEAPSTAGDDFGTPNSVLMVRGS